MDFPSKCPYCGKDIVENPIKDIWEKSNTFSADISICGIDLELHRCIHCKKPIFLAQEQWRMGKTICKSEIIHYYPTATTVDLPKRIKELSPTAYKTYEQTIKAKEQGFDMLVGAGLRIALEWLVWDYLIKVKGDITEAELSKLKLYERIELMSDNFYTEVCTRLIRLFGNDSVHIIKQVDFSVDEVIGMFNLLCSLIDSELQIKEVNDRLPKKP